MYSISLVFQKKKTKRDKTGYNHPALSALTNSAAQDTVPTITLDPVHRVVPQVVDISNINNAQSDVPTYPTNAYGLPPAVPAHSYVLPNAS